MLNTILNCDVLDGLKQLPDESVNCCITSPPYWGLRDYGNDEQIGLEKTPDEYVAKMVQVFSEVKRVLKNDGTLWLNLGDSYSSGGRGSYSNSEQLKGSKQATNRAWNHDINFNQTPRPLMPDGLKPKDLIGIPWLVAFALRSDGWYLRQDIIWHKPNPMPESVTDRCTKSHEYIFLLSKSQTYFYDYNAVLEEASGRSCGNRTYKYDGVPGMETKQGILSIADKEWDNRNKRSVWTVNTKPFKESHFATFPEKLIEPCIKAGCPEGGVVLDPFMGAGTTALVAKKLNRNYIGIELNPDYIKIAEKRIFNEIGLFV